MIARDSRDKIYLILIAAGFAPNQIMIIESPFSWPLSAFQAESSPSQGFVQQDPSTEEHAFNVERVEKLQQMSIALWQCLSWLPIASSVFSGSSCTLNKKNQYFFRNFYWKKKHYNLVGFCFSKIWKDFFHSVGWKQHGPILLSRSLIFHPSVWFLSV